MRFETFSRRAADQRSDCLVIGAFEQSELGTEATAVDRAMRGRIKTLLSRGDFSGKSGETLLLPEASGIRSQRTPGATSRAVPNAGGVSKGYSRLSGACRSDGATRASSMARTASGAGAGVSSFLT